MSGQKNEKNCDLQWSKAQKWGRKRGEGGNLKKAILNVEELKKMGPEECRTQLHPP